MRGQFVRGGCCNDDGRGGCCGGSGSGEAVDVHTNSESSEWLSREVTLRDADTLSKNTIIGCVTLQSCDIYHHGEPFKLRSTKREIGCGRLVILLFRSLETGSQS